MKVIIAAILLTVASGIFVWLLSDEHCDKWEEKFIEEILKEENLKRKE